jgi:hypothetical protein
LAKIILKKNKLKKQKKEEKEVNFGKKKHVKKATVIFPRVLELLIILCSNLDHPLVYYSGFFIFSIKVCRVTCHV